MKKLLLLTICAFFLTGCTFMGVTIKTGREKGGRNEAGVFKSLNHGQSWQQMVFVGQEKNKTLTIANVNVLKMLAHPSDSRIIYLTTQEDGAWVSYNGAGKWQALYSAKGAVNDLVPHPGSLDIMYLAFGNQIFKTQDRGGSWQAIYLENRIGALVTSLGMDFKNPKIIYAGNSGGDFLKSTDEGRSWTVLSRFEGPIKKIMINKNNPQIIYVVISPPPAPPPKKRGFLKEKTPPPSQEGNIFKTYDGGLSFKELGKNLKKYPGSLIFRELIFNESKSDGLLYASGYGLLWSSDGGESWQAISLLTPPALANIYAVAQNPKNPQEIYYITDYGFYRTVDGGRNWITTLLPTSGKASSLLIDFYDPSILYMGVGE